MNAKKAFITGITGQDGSYLAEFLLKKGYDVYATIRRSSSFSTQRIENIFSHSNLHLYYGDLSDSSNLHRLLKSIEPDEIYNLGAQSHVMTSFEVPEYTTEVDALGTIRILDAIRDVGISTKFYQASTSEMFGGVPGTEPQNETTMFTPRSPYAAAKLYAYWVTVNYREAYGLYGCNGILFNHESPRRGGNFISKKITVAATNIIAGKQDKLVIGNLDAERDWGYAGDYVESMWLMMQQEKPDDYVVATGESHTVRELITLAFGEVGMNVEWRGKGLSEVGIDAATGKVVVEVDRKYIRPAEVEILLGDISKAKRTLRWSPRVRFAELIKGMVHYDLLYDDYGGDENVEQVAKYLGDGTTASKR